MAAPAARPHRRLRSTLDHLRPSSPPTAAAAVPIPGSQLSTPALSPEQRAQPNYRPPKSTRQFVTAQEVSELCARTEIHRLRVCVFG